MKYPIEINSICKSFDVDKEVLKGTHLKVSPGEIFGLIGLNGVGKTTLIKIMLDLLNQDSGEVLFFGENAKNPESRRNISYLPEKFYPSQFLRGEEFLEISLANYGKKYNRETAEAIATRLELDPLALRQKISKYSKGMGQKLGLMSVFLSEVPLLILDEPMSGLDPSARIHLKALLQNYVKQGNSIFFSSHILSDIDEICHNIAVLDRSEIVFSGSPGDFKQKFNTDNLEQAFLKAINLNEEELA